MARKTAAKSVDPLEEILNETPEPGPEPTKKAWKDMTGAERIAHMNAAKARKAAARAAGEIVDPPKKSKAKAKSGADELAEAMGEAPAAPRKAGNLVIREAFLKPDTVIRVGPNSQKGVVEEMQRLMGKKPMTYQEALETVAASIDMSGRRTKLSPEAYAKDYICKWGIDKGFWQVVS